jgi:hypothetical protein
MVYEYTFANATVHVQPKSSDRDLDLLRLRASQKHQSVLSLLLTCQTMRREATPVFNGSVIFESTPYYNRMAAVY